LKDKLPEVHYKYALHVEDERRYAEAEAEFLKAKRPRDAVLMYVQIKDWDRGKNILYISLFDTFRIQHKELLKQMIKLY
jgi:translation initiation factor 1 (eIF-1/SUI1)